MCDCLDDLGIVDTSLAHGCKGVVGYPAARLQDDGGKLQQPIDLLVGGLGAARCGDGVAGETGALAHEAVRSEAIVARIDLGDSERYLLPDFGRKNTRAQRGLKPKICFERGR